jgi:alanine racemase
MGLSWLEIDAPRLRHNVRELRRHARGARLMAVVKANAYGHGARQVVPIVRTDADWLGVDALVEAEEIEDLRAGKPVLILGHTEPVPEASERVVAGRFRQALFRRDVALALSRAASRLGKPAFVHLKVETGLNRLGVPHSDVVDWADWLASLEGVTLEGVYTHFADVEDPDSSFVPIQRQRLLDAVEALRLAGHRGLLVHASPTAGALLYSPAHPELTLSRIGIGLYGVWPSEATRRAVSLSETSPRLLPVLTWKSRLAQVKSVPPGATVGYDLTYRAPSERRVGIVPVGYSDGFDRKLSGRGWVLVSGRRVPVVGRVAMNMFMVDVTGVDAREDDEVVLIGEQGDEAVTADEVASWSDTIAYEVLARLNPRLPRLVGSEAGELSDEGDVGGRPVERG